MRWSSFVFAYAAGLSAKYFACLAFGDKRVSDGPGRTMAFVTGLCAEPDEHFAAIWIVRGSPGARSPFA
jgi:hypothetical protein